MSEFENKGDQQNPAQPEGSQAAMGDQTQGQEPSQAQDAKTYVNPKQQPPTQDDLDRQYRRSKEMEGRLEQANTTIAALQRQLDQAIRQQDMAKVPKQADDLPEDIRIIMEQDPQAAALIKTMLRVAEHNIKKSLEPIQNRFKEEDERKGRLSEEEKSTRMVKEFSQGMSENWDPIDREIGADKLAQEDRGFFVSRVVNLMHERVFKDDIFPKFMDRVTGEPEWMLINREYRKVATSVLAQLRAIEERGGKTREDQLRGRRGSIPAATGGPAAPADKIDSAMEQFEKDGDFKKLRDAKLKEHFGD